MGRMPPELWHQKNATGEKLEESFLLMQKQLRAKLACSHSHVRGTHRGTLSVTVASLCV